MKVPFDINRAKGYVYQTGVWVPLIVSGPPVASPGREVKNMVNIADLFQLFGELAGVDVHKAVPASHVLDSQSMLPYLTNANQQSIRQTNFTQTSGNIHLNDMLPAPCVITLTSPPTCVQLFPQRQLCNFEGGDWYGDRADRQMSLTAPAVTCNGQVSIRMEWRSRNTDAVPCRSGCNTE